MQKIQVQVQRSATAETQPQQTQHQPNSKATETAYQAANERTGLEDNQRNVELHQRKIHEHQQYLLTEWETHCRVYLQVPPELLALEIKSEVRKFIEKISRTTQITLESIAIEQFSSQILSPTKSANQLVESISRSLRTYP